MTYKKVHPSQQLLFENFFHQYLVIYTQDICKNPCKYQLILDDDNQNWNMSTQVKLPSIKFHEKVYRQKGGCMN